MVLRMTFLLIRVRIFLLNQNSSQTRIYIRTIKLLWRQSFAFLECLEQSHQTKNLLPVCSGIGLAYAHQSSPMRSPYSGRSAIKTVDSIAFCLDFDNNISIQTAMNKPTRLASVPCLSYYEGRWHLRVVF
jgi:hypothetical protein